MRRAPSVASRRPRNRHGIGVIAMASRKRVIGAWFGASLLLALGAASDSRAISIVAPNASADLEGTSNGYFPFSTSAGFDMRYQQVYASSQFSQLSGPTLLTAIAFRPEGALLGDGALSGTIADVEIRLSVTSATPSTLSATFADNVGASEQVVFDGSLTLSSANVGNPGPKAFDLVIVLDEPFVYDPGLGNLLLDVRNFSGGWTTLMDAAVSSATARVYSALFGGGTDSVSGTVDAVGLVTQFTFSVPEPSGLGLALLGCLFVARNAMRRASCG
jgi:hypothetical protein